MSKRELVELLAARVEVSPAIAADEVDRVVSNILSKLRRGSPAPMPGLGVLESDGGRSVRLRPTSGKKGGR
ncbi:MAG: hypothetical protein HY820_11445 [Acidobacteria bacterium]|nr:hypothetical protein [Acidobacteriota bacterium]